MKSNNKAIAQTILGLERAALERWNKGDVDGYLELYTDDVTYFDPKTEIRFDGHNKVEQYYREFAEGKVDMPYYEIINPQVIVNDTMAVLTYNLAYYTDREHSLASCCAWNSTQVYSLIDQKWRVVHANWSFTRHPAILSAAMA